MTAKRRRFTSVDWLDLGLAQLSEHGTEGIKLEAICAAAGLTRGSFYYHFKDHGAFLVGLAKHWAAKQTDAVAEDAAAQAAVGTDQHAAALTEAALQIDYRLELGMRELARRVAAVDEILRATDAKRRDVLTQSYVARFGLSPEQAAQYAYLEYATFCGVILLDPDLAPEQQKSLAALHEQMVKKWLSDDLSGLRSKLSHVFGSRPT